MPSARFEPATSAIQRPQTFALDRKTTGIGSFSFNSSSTGCGRNNSHILKVNKNQTKQDKQKILLFIKSTYDAFFSNTFKDNIGQVLAVIDDTTLKPFTEVAHGLAGHRGRNGGDFFSYCLL